MECDPSLYAMDSISLPYYCALKNGNILIISRKYKVFMQLSSDFEALIIKMKTVTNVWGRNSSSSGRG